MTTLRLILFLIPAIAIVNTAAGQINEKITDKFFADFKIDKEKAYEKLLENVTWIDKSSIETVKIKYKDFLNGLGEYLGFEPIAEKVVGESYALKSFLVKFGDQPIRFTFTLYKPKEAWRIQSFSYDSNLSEELEEAAKAYRLKYNW
jgi:hypothetical protein